MKQVTFQFNYVILFSLFILLLVGCKTTQTVAITDLKPKTQQEIDQEKIKQYINTKGLQTSITQSGIHYIIERAGEGENPSPYAVATVNYRGTFLDGTQFWSSYDNGETEKFQLNQVVDGWMQGVPMLKKGGKGLFIIPSRLAYGAKGNEGAGIEPNTILVFEIELIDFYESSIKDQVLAMEDFIAKNGLNMKKTKSGIHYQIDNIGNGWGPVLDSQITINYTGKLLNGTTFWSTYDAGQPIKTNLREAVRAFTEILPMIREGGRVKILIPSNLGYGNDGLEANQIPPNAVLYYDLELVDVE